MRERRQAIVDTYTQPDQDLRPDDVQRPLEQIEADRQQRQRHQRLHRTAAERSIVDLQHVERAGERQHIDDAGDQEQGQDGYAGQPGEVTKIGLARSFFAHAATPLTACERHSGLPPGD